MFYAVPSWYRWYLLACVAAPVVLLGYSVFELTPNNPATNQSTASCQVQQQTQAQLNSVQLQLNSLQAQLAGIESAVEKK